MILPDIEMFNGMFDTIISLNIINISDGIIAQGDWNLYQLTL